MGLLSGLLGGGGMSSGGVGNSASTNDSRVYDLTTGAGDDSTINATNTVVTGGTVTMGDYGAVQGALKLALAGVEGANKLAGDVSASNAGLLDGALSNSKAQNAQFTSALENIKTSDVRVLIFGALAVVALVGFAIFSKKGG